MSRAHAFVLTTWTPPRPGILCLTNFRESARNEAPRSYLPADEREALMREGGMDLVYLSESQAAGRAGDEDAAWIWLSFVELEPQTLMSLKRRTSGQFIREKKKADEAYGPGWLDRA